ncbi:MAG: DDE-type integrase/transposase/recombinase [Planctomycetes bacterium]|nr:DDE-type integrase/transposase/recombinase [Planctomycetota bacterium]
MAVITGRAGARFGRAGAPFWRPGAHPARSPINERTVHALRRLFPEAEFGTRTIARHLIRAGIRISRRTVQRVCREKPPVHPRSPRLRRPSITPPTGVEPDHLLAPATVNRVWHLDLAEYRFLWLHFTIVVLLDGCSRKLLHLTAFAAPPTSDKMIAVIENAVGEYGRPDFLITDHGCQFRRMFRAAMKAANIRHVRGKVRCPSFNGKAERLIRTLRLWLRGVLLPMTVTGVQRRLDHFQGWYNAQRPHAALDGRTPDEMWHDRAMAAPTAYRARDGCSPGMTVRRVSFAGDPRLPVVRIKVERRRAA